jgi:hypothetical protein
VSALDISALNIWPFGRQERIRARTRAISLQQLILAKPPHRGLCNFGNNKILGVWV